MQKPDDIGAHQFPRVPVSQQDSEIWFTVAEAVLRCTERGLPRTPKTVRKWAARSFAVPENADISVRREDTENGFRWSIERTSLDRKIDEELEFEARKFDEQVDTGADMFEPVPEKNPLQTLNEPPAHQSEPVHTGADESGQSSRIEDELRARLEQTQQEVEFLRGELIHRRKTDEALGSVIEAFRLNSETNQSRALKGGDRHTQGPWQGALRHDIVRNDRQDDVL